MDRCSICDEPYYLHEHFGNVNLPLLIKVRKDNTRVEMCFHGTKEQCEQFIFHPESYRQEELVQFLVEFKDWDRALKAFEDKYPR